MSSFPIRDQKIDHLITPENSALVIVDYQPIQVNSINSMPRQDLIRNIIALAELIKGFNIPVVLTTVRAGSDPSKGTIPSLADVLKGVTTYDRTTINAWEDKEVYEAIKGVNRKKLIMAALWTEACLSMPTLNALKEGFEVYPVVDAVGGTSKIAHDTALRRVEQAGAELTTIAQLACELQRDWAREATVPVMIKALQNTGGFLKL